MVTEDSILLTTKRMIGGGFDPEQTDFDVDIITHINAAFSILTDLGVGPESGFSISDATTNWASYETGSDVILNKVKSYMYAKVRLWFDPPANASLLESLNKVVNEFEWRLNVNAEELETSKKES